MLIVCNRSLSIVQYVLIGDSKLTLCSCYFGPKARDHVDCVKQPKTAVPATKTHAESAFGRQSKHLNACTSSGKSACGQTRGC